MNQSPAMPVWIIFLVTLLAQWGIYGAGKLYSGKVHIGRASALMIQKDTVSAEKEAEAGTLANAYDGYGWFQYGAALYMQGKFKDAVPVLKRAIPVLPHEYNAIRLLGFSNFFNENWKDALEYLDQYLLMNPDPVVTPDVVFQRAGIANLRSNKLGTGIFYLTKATQAAEDKAAILRARATLSVLGELFSDAEYCFYLFKFLYPDRGFDLNELVSMAAERSKLPEASQFIRKLSELDSTDVSLLQSLAQAQDKNNQTSAALATIESGISIEPANPSLRLIYGNILMNAQRKQDALVQYEEHLRLDPKSRYRSEIEKIKALP